MLPVDARRVGRRMLDMQHHRLPARLEPEDVVGVPAAEALSGELIAQPVAGLHMPQQLPRHTVNDGHPTSLHVTRPILPQCRSALTRVQPRVRGRRLARDAQPQSCGTGGLFRRLDERCLLPQLALSTAGSGGRTDHELPGELVHGLVELLAGDDCGEGLDGCCSHLV
jgi:hypothetical protein